MELEVINHLRRCRTCCGTFRSPEEKVPITVYISTLYKYITNFELDVVDSLSKNICMVCFVSLNKSFTFKNKLFTSRSKIKNFTDCGFHDPNKIVFKTEVLDLTIPSTSAGLKQELSDDNSTATVEANHDMTVPSFPIPMITEPSQPQENMSESESSASLTIPEDYFDALEFESMEDIEIKSEIEIEKPQFNVAVEEPEASTSVVSQAHTQFAEPQTMIPEAIIPTFPVYIRCHKCQRIIDKEYIYHHLAIEHSPKLKVKRLSRRNYPQFVCKKCSELFKTKAMLVKHLEATIPCKAE